MKKRNTSIINEIEELDINSPRKKLKSKLSNTTDGNHGNEMDISVTPSRTSSVTSSTLKTVKKIISKFPANFFLLVESIPISTVQIIYLFIRKI